MDQDNTLIDPRTWYRDACDKSGFVCDATQMQAIEELEILWQKLVEFKHKRNRFLGRSLLSPAVPRGLYLWGEVGRGKTFLMDGFYHCLPYRRKRRIHFHNFMSEVHHELKRLAHSPDPLIALADNIAQATRLLCLDELHVDDIADAMILGRLFDALFSRGVVLLTTSNYAPDGLYPNGLQRDNFLPAIELLKNELKVLHFEGNRDYRQLQRVRDPVFWVCDGETDADDASDKMESIFQRLAAGKRTLGGYLQSGHIALRCAADGIVWFDFKALCGGNFDQTDYLQIAHHYHTLFLSGVPKMHAENAAEARRFVWLIDVLYDNHVKLVASFDVLPERLYEAGYLISESQRITSRLAEMQTHQYLGLTHLSHGVSLTECAD